MGGGLLLARRRIELVDSPPDVSKIVQRAKNALTCHDTTENHLHISRHLGKEHTRLNLNPSEDGVH